MSAPRLSLARLPRAVAFGAGAGLGAALPLSRVPRTTTAVTAGATVAALVAAGAAMGPVEPKTGDPGTGESAPQRGRLARLAGGVAFGSAIGVVVGGSLWLNLRVDAALEDLLRRRGVARPRLALALGAGVLTGLLEWADAGEAGNAGEAPADARAEPRAAGRADAHTSAPAVADGKPGRADAPAVTW